MYVCVCALYVSQKNRNDLYNNVHINAHLFVHIAQAMRNSDDLFLYVKWNKFYIPVLPSLIRRHRTVLTQPLKCIFNIHANIDLTKKIFRFIF